MEPTQKKKFKIRTRHLKKAVLIATYSLVVVMMIASTILPAFQ